MTVYAPLLSQLAAGRSTSSGVHCGALLRARIQRLMSLWYQPVPPPTLCLGGKVPLSIFALDVALLHPGQGFDLLELQQDFGDALRCAHLGSPLLQWRAPETAQCAHPNVPWSQGLRSLSGPWPGHRGGEADLGRQPLVAVAASGAGVFWTNSMSCLLCSLQWATREELRNCRGGGHPCVASVLATISMGKAPDRDSSQSGAHCSAGPCMQAPARVIAGCGSW